MPPWDNNPHMHWRGPLTRVAGSLCDIIASTTFWVISKPSLTKVENILIKYRRTKAVEETTSTKQKKTKYNKRLIRSRSKSKQTSWSAEKCEWLTCDGFKFCIWLADAMARVILDQLERVECPNHKLKVTEFKLLHTHKGIIGLYYQNRNTPKS